MGMGTGQDRRACRALSRRLGPARLGELGERLLNSGVAAPLAYAAAGSDTPCVGLLPWAVAVETFLERAS